MVVGGSTVSIGSRSEAAIAGSASLTEPVAQPKAYFRSGIERRIGQQLPAADRDQRGRPSDVVMRTAVMQCCGSTMRLATVDTLGARGRVSSCVEGGQAAT